MIIYSIIYQHIHKTNIIWDLNGEYNVSIDDSTIALYKFIAYGL